MVRVFKYRPAHIHTSSHSVGRTLREVCKSVVFVRKEVKARLFMQDLTIKVIQRADLHAATFLT